MTDTDVPTVIKPITPMPSPRYLTGSKAPRRAAAGIVVVATVAGAIWFLSRGSSDANSSKGEQAGMLPVVAVEKVERADLAQTLSLAAEFKPFEQVALHAKVAGYLQAIWVDVGDHVREGQALAQLDVPELQDELRKATAAFHGSEQEVARAEAHYSEAHLSFQRLRDVAKGHPKLVAQQEVDAATARDATARSAVEAAKQKVQADEAEVSKLKALIGYTTIYAPFDGIITRRFADPGALIQAGTAANAQPLVEIVGDKKLRLGFPVPESSVPLVQLGAKVRVTVGTLGQTFDAAVSRFSGKVDRATRTMWTEVDVENTDNRFKPGMIAEVALVVRESKGVVAVPVQAVAVGEKPSVLVVNNGEIVEQRLVKLGLETPTKAEVVDGLQAGDRVLVGSRNGIQPGQKVTAKLLAAATE